MVKRRAVRGTGSVFEDTARHRWVGKVTIDGQEVRVYARDKTGARAKLNAAIRNDGKPAPDKVSRTPTVAKLVDDWLVRNMAGRDLAPSTVERHKRSAVTIKAAIGSVRADKLTARKVDEMLDDLAERGLARDTIAKVLNTLSQALRFAVKRGDIARNVATDATIPPSAARTVARRSLSPDDARTLLEVLRGERNGLMFALSLRCGLRPGEAAALYWSDVTGNVVNVTRGLRIDRGRASIVDDLKTQKSKRTIEVPAEMGEWFAAHRAEQIADRLAARSWVDDRLVFTSPTGNVLSPPNTRKQLAAICERAGVPVITPNELRHSCASFLADIGVPNELIADLLGHTTTRMVDVTYRHRLRPVVDVAARADWATATS